MRLDEKARENLEAAERLLSTMEGTELPLHNASVSRAYYAAYQAVADRALRDGLAFDSTRDYFRHDALPGRARDHGILDLDQHDELALLYELRIRPTIMRIKCRTRSPRMLRRPQHESFVHW